MLLRDIQWDLGGIRSQNNRQYNNGRTHMYILSNNYYWISSEYQYQEHIPQVLNNGIHFLFCVIWDSLQIKKQNSSIKEEQNNQFVKVAAENNIDM